MQTTLRWVLAAGALLGACRQAVPQATEPAPPPAGVSGTRSPGSEPGGERQDGVTARAVTRPLGSAPLCEASAAVALEGAVDGVLVADNELSDVLFRFGVDAAGLVGGQAVAMPEGEGPRDIEALAAWGEHLLVVGSHSRNRRCEVKRKRQRLRLLRVAPAAGEGVAGGIALTEEAAFDTHATWGGALDDEEGCLATLFVSPAPEGAAELCAALAAAEREAGEGPCRTLDLEAAVALPEADGVGIWLGLRSPQVRADEAVLLRLRWPLGEPRFDRVSTLPLEGDGVRGMALWRGQLWLSSGPADDGERGFVLWSLSPSGLAAGEVSSLRRVGALPPSSEGLVGTAAGLIAVTDGAAGDDEGACRKPSTQTLLGEAGASATEAGLPSP